MAASASERLAAARQQVDRACQLLGSPTARQMDDCAWLLQSAIAELTAARHCAPAEPDSKKTACVQARRLQASIDRAGRLLESAGTFYANWIRFLRVLTGGYTGGGEPAALDRGARLLARG